MFKEVYSDRGDYHPTDGWGWMEEELFPDAFVVAVFWDLDNVVVTVFGDSSGFFDVGESELGLFQGV